MAYSFYLYAPQNVGIASLSVLGYIYETGAFVRNETVYPAGDSVSAFHVTGTNESFLIGVTFEGTTPNYRWVVNVDGVVSSAEPGSFFYIYAGTESVVQVRLEVSEGTTYRGSVVLSANGGSLGNIEPTRSYEVVGIGTAVYTFPVESPTRSGYTFTGWGDAAENPAQRYGAGEIVIVELSRSEPYPVHYFYAQWIKKSDGGVWLSKSNGAAPTKHNVYICPYNGAAPVRHIPYVHDGTKWVKRG